MFICNFQFERSEQLTITLCPTLGAFMSLISHLTVSDLISIDDLVPSELSAMWLVTATANWEAIQFAVTATSYSALSLDDMRSDETELDGVTPLGVRITDMGPAAGDYNNRWVKSVFSFVLQLFYRLQHGCKSDETNKNAFNVENFRKKTTFNIFHKSGQWVIMLTCTCQFPSKNH